VAGLALLAGCASAPASYEVPVPVPAEFTGTGQAALPDLWWTAFGDARLDSLQAMALRENLELQTAWERLLEARATARIAGAPRYPSLDAFADGELSRPSANEDGTLDLGLAASFEVDLWGRIGARASAEQLRAQAGEAEYRATAITLSAEVAVTWYRLLEAQSAHDLLSRQEKTNSQALDLLSARFGNGLVSRPDILRQKQLVETTREQALAVEAEAGLLRHRLEILLGKAPGSTPDIRTGVMPQLPPVPRTGLPAELVQRRPDVLAAYLRLQAADRDLAAAVSDRYPRLTLSASVSTRADGSTALFDDWLRNLAGGLLAPVLRGGELAAEVDRAEARRRQRLLEYGRTVLAAFGEVEDALLREGLRLRRIASLELQVRYATEAADRLRLEYLNGAADFLDVLTARVDQQRLERDLLAVRLARVEDRIALYRALAGGFEPARAEQENGD